ncbi:MAG: hypothetical protein FWH37_07470 [Candidatus Bathyarchaeota archaeon]|nr:hypothetical protein [Candidatus Termiticorpusculum sp.]
MRAYNSKFLALTITYVMLSILIVSTVYPVFVQAASKPSVPQFSLKFIDNSYTVPPTQTIDPYTGITTTQPSYIVNDMRIDVTIKNQRFTLYTDAQGRECNLYYRVEVKGHFEEDTWHAFYSYYYNNFIDLVSFVVPSSSEYTVVSSGARYDEGSQLDFRVKAFTGYWVEPTMEDHLTGFHDPRLVEAESSNWSSTQVVAINYGTSLPLPSQTTILPPELTATPDNYLSQINLKMLIVFTCIIAILIIVIIYLAKKKLVLPDNVTYL